MNSKEKYSPIVHGSVPVDKVRVSHVDELPGPGHGNVMACPNCDLVNSFPEKLQADVLCARCKAVLYRYRPNSIDRSLALTFATVILFLLSNSFSFLAMKSGGFIQKTTLLSGVHELWKQGSYLVSLLVLLTCFLVPLLQMAGLLYILVPLKWFRNPAPLAIHVLRILQEIAPWGMMEVFMIGILVALVKLGHMATIIPGTSAYSFGALIFIMSATFSTLDLHLLWNRLDLRR